jgi:Ni,Fe-hydrogenase III large subunit
MAHMTTLRDVMEGGRLIKTHRPWPRVIVDREAWEQATSLLVDGQFTLLGLWGAKAFVHMAVVGPGNDGPAVLSLACDHNSFPSVGRLHPPAIRLERTVRDLVGLEAEGLVDARPWLDHGTWRLRRPFGVRGSAGASDRYAFLPVEGEGLHQIAVGPVHAGIIEPGHFRFTANGETIVRLEERLGYVHKGIESLMVGLSIERAAVLAGRVSGDSTVAYALAFARAVEAALGTHVPQRAVWLRALMAELERLANHFGDLGAVCNDAAFAMLHAQFGLLREYVLRVADKCFGHRLMMDRIAPGGVLCDLSEDEVGTIAALIARIRAHFPELVELYDNTASLQDRTVGTGILTPALARQFGAGGYVGRASGRAFDARRTPAYPPYDALQFEVAVLEDGDVNARLWIRVREVEQSMGIIDQILRQLPSGAIRATLPARLEIHAGEGVALVEGFRGDVLAWVQLREDGSVERCHLRDPSWFQWPLLEAVIEGNIVADFPLCNKSFNCSYSGHDL